MRQVEHLDKFYLFGNKITKIKDIRNIEIMSKSISDLMIGIKVPYQSGLERTCCAGTF